MVINVLFFLQKKKEAKMANQISILNNPYQVDWAAYVQETHWPVFLPSSDQPTPDLFTPPELFFSPIAGAMPVWQPGKKRRGLDRVTARLLDTGFPGVDVAVEYLRDKYTKNLSASTIDQSGRICLFFLTFLQDRGTNIYEVSRTDINAFVAHEHERGLKINSVRGHLRSLYAFINYLIDKGLLPFDILRKKIRIKEPEVLPKAIPAEDIALLLREIISTRDRALILLLLRTGMRIGELLQVKMTDIILPEKKILLFLGEKNFQGRVVYFNVDAFHALQQWIAVRDVTQDYLFYSKGREQISYVACWMVMKKALERAGLDHKGYSLHSLRHTFATDMLNAGMRLEVLQQLLGHKSIDITMRYARMSDKTRENEYFKAMATIEQGEQHESHRVNSPLQAVFEEKKLLRTHRKKLSS
ncbi:tyrosine-type recombinase/integrase [uncultured Vibrio sp.]|uniref:tyrosine-type recombinase/integrase n=1 Tax=uncultured Vibrio sp. TaxID=114054 RepID=UPI002AA68F23|nr:tyrosine-type recombinase/integrase [uncultured Vibrio sp.]